MADVWALAVATAVVVAPGGALLLALGVRRPLWWIAVTPPASVGLATLTAMACAVIGVRYGPVALGLATALLAATGVLRFRSSGGSLVRGGRACLDRLPGLVLVAAGVGLGVLVWTHGLGSMATIGQEHDLIVHGVVTAYIQESGHGAPWQLLPADLLTGEGVTFYPAGLHLLMAATASLTGSTVVGINAVSAVVLGAGWTSGSAALAHVAARRARLDPSLALMAAGTAAIVAAGLYRPTIALVQWGGTIPNAATLALTPGLLAALLTLPRPTSDDGAGQRPRRGGPAEPATPAQPTTAPTVVASPATNGWLVAVRRFRHALPRSAAAGRLVGRWVAAVWRSVRQVPAGSAVPVAGQGPVRVVDRARDRAEGVGGRGVRGWSAEVRGSRGHVPVGAGVVVGVAVAGMLAIHPSAVVTVGVSVLAWWGGEALGGEGRRRLVGQAAPLLVAGVVAAVVAAPMLVAMSQVAADIGAFQPDIDPIAVGDALDRILRMTYNVGDPRQKLAAAQAAAGALALVGAVVLTATRRALGAVTAWLAWVAIVTAAWVRPGRGVPGMLTDVFYDAQMRVWSHASLFVPTLAGVGLAVTAGLAGAAGAAATRPGGGGARRAAVLMAGTLAVAYLAGPGYRYSRADVEALASRYARPDYTRVSAGDRRAVKWLAGQVAPGERVLNSANDGSTLLYVDRRIPIVNVASLGSAAEPATYRLLQRFNRYPVDPDVRRMLRELDVRWVYVDMAAPTVSASGAPLAWAGQWLSVPGGLRELGGLPGLERRFRSGNVSVYHLDPAAIAEPDEPGTRSGEGPPSS